MPEEALLSEDDLETIDQALVSAAGCKPKKMKKPAAQKCAKKEDGSRKNKSSETGGTALKCTFRHRKTSSAYNSEKAKYKRMGYSPSTCKKMASAAWLKVAQEIDSGILKEPAVDVD